MLLRSLRFVVSWLVMALGLLLMAQFIPGVKLSNFISALIGTLILSAISALLRPVVIRLTLRIYVFSLGLFSLVVNGIILWLASTLTSGFNLDGIAQVALVSILLTILNIAVIGAFSLGSNDDYFDQIIARLKWKYRHTPKLKQPGVFLLEIDGLAEPTLQCAIREGHMPTLARWLKTGTHQLMKWDTGLPSQTSSMQAGILHGNNVDIPAFRWFEKDQQRLMVSNHPADAYEINRRISNKKGVLHQHGISVNNLVTGDAEQIVLTMSHLQDDHKQLILDPNDFYSFFSYPYGYERIVLFTLWEILVEMKEAWQQRRKDIRPRISRSKTYALVRAITCVAIRDLSVFFLIEDMFKNMSSGYTTFVGYDEVAHHSGPETSDAMRVLRHIDNRFYQLEKAARKAPRPYQFVVLSDHGQTTGAPFRQRYGVTLEDLVQSLVPEGVLFAPTLSGSEGSGKVGALVAELGKTTGFVVRMIERLLIKSGYDSSYYPNEKKEEAKDPEIIVCVSGNLGLIYFAQKPGRLSYEQINEQYPNLIKGLVNHEGIAFVMVRSQAEGPLVIGQSGRRRLDNNHIEGHDPLEGFGPHDAEHLQRLDSFSNVGDIVVNSMYDLSNGQIAPFEEFAGSHGGLGGNQNIPFILFPKEFASVPPIVGSHNVYPVLLQWLKLTEENPN
jgi:putative membrane protein